MTTKTTDTTIIASEATAVYDDLIRRLKLTTDVHFIDATFTIGREDEEVTHVTIQTDEIGEEPTITVSQGEYGEAFLIAPVVLIRTLNN